MIEDFLDELNISLRGSRSSSGSYVIDIADSEEFAKIFSLLDKSDLVEEDGDQNIVTFHNTSQLFRGDDYDIVLLGDLDEDHYKMVISEVRGWFWKILLQM